METPKGPATLSKFEPIIDATENQAELIALLKAVKRMKTKCHLIIYTESNYVRSAFESEWIVVWNSNGWKTAKNKEIANAEEWKELYTELEGHKIEFRMVKTHPYKDWMEMEIRNCRKGE